MEEYGAFTLPQSRRADLLVVPKTNVREGKPGEEESGFENTIAGYRTVG